MVQTYQHRKLISAALRARRTEFWGWWGEGLACWSWLERGERLDQSLACHIVLRFHLSFLNPEGRVVKNSFIIFWTSPGILGK